MNSTDKPALPVNFYVAAALALAGAIWLFSAARDVVGYFFAALVISYLLNPLTTRLEGRRIPIVKKPLPRSAAILMLFGAFAAFCALAAALVLPPAAKQIEAFAREAPTYAETARSKFDLVRERWEGENFAGRIPPEAMEHARNASGKLVEAVQAAVQTVGTRLIGGLGRLGSQLMGLVLVPILTFYMLNDAPKAKGWLLSALPPRFRKETDLVLQKVDAALGAFIRGQIKLCAAMGALSWIAFTLIGMKYAFVFGLIAGATEFIPYLGPVLGFIGPVALSLFMGPAMAVKTIALFVAVQLIEGNVLAPKIIGKDVGLHPALIMFVMMVGGKAGGVTGMIFAIPAAAVLKVLYLHFYVEKVVKAEERAERRENGDA